MKYQVLTSMTVMTPKGIMEIQPGQIISFSPEKAKSYIEKGKIKPQEDPFEEMFKKAIAELNKRWVDGTFVYLQAHQPNLYQEINRAESKVDHVWLSGREGRATLDEFRGVLKNYYLLVLKGSRKSLPNGKTHRH